MKAGIIDTAALVRVLGKTVACPDDKQGRLFATIKAVPREQKRKRNAIRAPEKPKAKALAPTGN